MKTIRILTLTALLATSGFFGIAHAETKPAGKDIVAVAAGNGSFNTLVAALKAAGLVETLKERGRSPSSRRRTKPSPSSPRAR